MAHGLSGRKCLIGFCFTAKLHGSALVGITAVHLIDQYFLAIPAALSLSISEMFMLRYLHPPVAAVALIAVLSHISGYRYAFFPVMVGSILLIIVGVDYSNLTGKRYPNRPQ